MQITRGILINSLFLDRGLRLNKVRSLYGSARNVNKVIYICD